MSDEALRQIFRAQAGRLWHDFLPCWGRWLGSQDATELTRLRHLLHTLKGSALALDQLVLAEACHALESAWDEVPAEPAALVAWARLSPLWRQHVDASASAPAQVTVAGLEQAVAAFFRRTAEQLDLAVELDCRLAPGWAAEQALLWDVLPHLLRNALTHGAEPADVRLAAGKPARLRVWVRGREQPAGLCLLVADDGAGQRRALPADLWSGRGLGVAAVRVAVARHGRGQGRLQWRGSPGRGGVARIRIFK